MPADFLVIANPTSGRRSAPDLALRVTELLRAAGRKTELAVTSEHGDARRCALEAVDAGTKVIVGCGGDGTLHEIANMLAGTQTVLGILPGGRCNDLARVLGIRRRDPPEMLAEKLLSGPTRKIDLGVYRPLGAAGSASAPKYFCTVATLGFDSAVTQFVRTHRFPVKGAAEYLHGIIRVMMSYKAPVVRLRGDFGAFEGRVFLAATGNSSSYGGSMMIVPDAKIDDGLLDLCLVNEVSKLTLLRILPKVFKGGHVGHPAVKMLRTSRLEIETPDGPQEICADGEVLGQTPAILEVAASVLHVKVKRS